MPRRGKNWSGLSTNAINYGKCVGDNFTPTFLRLHFWNTFIFAVPIGFVCPLFYLHTLIAPAERESERKCDGGEEKVRICEGVMKGCFVINWQIDLQWGWGQENRWIVKHRLLLLITHDERFGWKMLLIFLSYSEGVKKKWNKKTWLIFSGSNGRFDW